MLVTKFKPQFNETIKSLQFRKLYRFKGKSAEECRGRLHMAAAECSYREVDQQLKEQFIHGLNDKTMLDEVIRELTAKIVMRRQLVRMCWYGQEELKCRGHRQPYSVILLSHKNLTRLKWYKNQKNRQAIETTHQPYHKWPCKY